MDARAKVTSAAGMAGGILGTAAVLVTIGMALLQPLPPPAPDGMSGAAGPERIPGQAWQQIRPCDLSPPGEVRGRLFGAINTLIEWGGSEPGSFRCDGMLRPGGEGVRLFFAGPGPGSGHLLLVIGIDGALGGLAGREAPANVTLIDESTGRFYASSGAGRCWTTITGAGPGGDRNGPAPGRAQDWRIEGTLYCAGSLPALHDRSAVTPGDLRFAGRVATGTGMEPSVP